MPAYNFKIIVLRASGASVNQETHWILNQAFFISIHATDFELLYITDITAITRNTGGIESKINLTCITGKLLENI